MSPDELDKMERMWHDRVPVDVIADELGYSASTIGRTARMFRRRFPFRKGMMPKELDELERLWKDGRPLSEISRLMGVSVQAIQSLICNDRDRFPYRKKRVPREVSEMWVERIRTGRATVDDAAKKLGVHRVTVDGWLKRWNQ